MKDGERLMKVETKLDMHVEQGVKDHESIMAKLQSIIDFQETLDAKYSAKWVENGILGLGGTVIAAVIYAMIKLI